MSNNCSCSSNSNCKSKKTNQDDFNIKSSTDSHKEKNPKTAGNNQWA